MQDDWKQFQRNTYALSGAFINTIPIQFRSRIEFLIQDYLTILVDTSRQNLSTEQIL